MNIKRIKKKEDIINRDDREELMLRGFQIMDSSKSVTLRGVIELNDSYDTDDMYYYICNKEFEIQVSIDRGIKTLPKVIEISKKVDPKYHRYSNGTLCLGSSIELWQSYSTNHSIIKYIDDFIKPYFFRYCCMQEYGSFPIGEYSHKTGVLESYMDLLGTFKKGQIILMLDFYLKEKNELCPCGSSKRFKECHYKTLSNNINLVPRHIVESDIKKIKRIGYKNKFKKYR